MTSIALGVKDSFLSLFKDWSKYEIAWLAISTIVITALAVIWESSPISLISSIAGILCVVFAAKGKIATFYVGLIQAGTYAYVSYGYGLYGEAMLNAFFYFPIQFVGLYMWFKHSKKRKEAVNGEDVYAKRLSLKQWLILIPVTLVAVLGYAVLLETINAQQVRLDSAAVVLSIVAQFLMLFRYAEQWILWIVVNVLTISLWFATLISSGGNDWTLAAMWTAFLVNSIYGYVNWRKISKAAELDNAVVLEKE